MTLRPRPDAERKFQEVIESKDERKIPGIARSRPTTAVELSSRSTKARPLEWPKLTLTSLRPLIQLLNVLVISCWKFPVFVKLHTRPKNERYQRRRAELAPNNRREHVQ